MNTTAANSPRASAGTSVSGADASADPTLNPRQLTRTRQASGARRLRVIGSLMVLAGAVMLGLLFSPWKDWALNYSVAAFVSATDRRSGNTIDGPVDMPMAIVGDIVVIFAGLWTAVLMPHMLNKFVSSRQS